MDNFKRKHTICQCLSFVPFEKLPALRIHQSDRGKQKLFTIPLLKVFIAAQLNGWRSYEEMEHGLQADKQFCVELGISSMSGSHRERQIAPTLSSR